MAGVICFPGSLSGVQNRPIQTPGLKSILSQLQHAVCVVGKALSADVVQALAPLGDKQVIEKAHPHLLTLRQVTEGIIEQGKISPGIENDAEALGPTLDPVLLKAARGLHRCVTEFVAPTPLRKRLMLNAVVLVLSPLISVLPLAVARIQGNKQYFGLLVAGYTKTFVVLLGLLLKPRINMALVLDHFETRHVPYLAPTLPYALLLCWPRLQQFSKQWPLPYALIAGVFVGLVYLFSSKPELIGKPAQQLIHGLRAVVRGIAPNKTQAEAADPQAGAGPKDAMPEVMGMGAGTSRHSALQANLDALNNNLNDLIKLRTNSSVPISDPFNILFTRVIAASKTLQAVLQESYSLPSSSCRSSSDNMGPNPALHDDHARRTGCTKWTLAVVAALLCVSSAIPFLREPVAAVDILTDAGLTIYKMIEVAKNPNANVQSAIEAFINYSGLAPLFFFYGLMNKELHILNTIMGQAVANTALALAGLSLPRLLATGISTITVSAVNRLSAIRCARASLDARASFDAGIQAP